MNNTSLCFLMILNCFLNNKKTENIYGNVDWEELYKLSEIHNVQGMIWSVLKNDSSLKIPKEIAVKFNAAFIASVNISARQEMALEQIKNKLDEYGVKHIFMKGSVVRNYYPIKELRTMGDIDYLISEESRELCHKAMIELGYTPAVEGVNVWEYSGKLAYVEVHNKIIYQKLFLGVDYTKYFSDVFDNVVPIGGNTYVMTPEYHFVYIVVHLAKHLYRVGCGIRMVADIPVYIKHFENNLDWVILEKRFREIKLWDFVQNLMYLCVKYFDCKLPEYIYNINDKTAEALMKYILAAGVFGRYNRNEYAVKFGIENVDKKNIDKISGKIKTVLRMIFPDYETMCGWYSWFKGKPKWMLPYGWTKRAYIQLRYKNSTIIDKLTGAVSEDDEKKEHKEIMSMIGLIK